MTLVLPSADKLLIFLSKTCVLAVQRMLWLIPFVMQIQAIQPCHAIFHRYNIFSSWLAGNHWVWSLHQLEAIRP